MLMGLALVTSCSDSLFDKYPTDTMQIETYVKNDTEALNILYDAYYYLRNVSYYVTIVNSVATDEAYDWKKNNSSDDIALNECSWDATLGVTSSIWEYCFNMINRCNTVLDNIENVSEANRAQYEGEAKFFRAYAYFTLVRLFGPVPKTTSVISDYRTLYDYDRASEDEIYSLIIEDLERAAAVLPSYYTDDTMLGRATDIAAYTMLGDVYMTQGNYSEAATMLEKVISFSENNPTRLGLEEDIYNIYDSTNPIGKEIILAAQFNNGSTVVSNSLMSRCIPNITPVGQPSYIYHDGTESNIPVSVGNSAMMMTYDLWNRLRSDPSDKRYTALTYDGIYNDEAVSVPSDEVKVHTIDGVNYTCMPTSLKYFDRQNESVGLSRSSCDNIIYRYAGVLLMYAECLNEMGTGDPVKYLDMVRTRAGVAGTNASGKEEIRLAIENENMLELCFEGHRWYNLVRTDRITPVMEAHFAHRTPGLSPTIQASENGMTVDTAEQTTGTSVKWMWSGKSAAVLFPVPYDQIQLTDWTQNEMY